MKQILITFVLFRLLTIASHSDEKRLPETIVRIRVLKDVNSIAVGCQNKYYLYNLKTGKNYRVAPDNVYLIQPYEGNILINDKIIDSDQIRFTVSAENTNTGNSCINIDGKPYRDSIIVKVYDTDKLIVINETGLESYLCGILPHEIDPKWLMEALKAQAVVSRTFAMKNLESRHSGTGYNFCNEVHCQVYGGTRGEDERSNKAVDLTKGEVLTYKGELVNTVYHACCGGHTESSKHVWLSKYKQPVYLSGRVCGFCKDSPHYYWSQTVEEKFIRKNLVKAGHKIGEITSIIPYGRTKSGRMKWVKIKYKKKNRGITNKVLTSAQLRMIVSPWIIRSTRSVRITKEGDNFKFVGRGWGHGVGMCQWGSKGMAESGYNYEKILKHYYPKTKIEKWAY